MTGWESLVNFLTPRTFNNWMDARRKAPKDMSLPQKHLALPLHSFKVIPALERTFRAALQRPDHYHSLVDSLSREDDTRMYNTQILDAFRQLDPAGYKKFREYMISRDLWPGVGYHVYPRKADGKFVLHGMPDAHKTTKKPVEIGVYDTERQAWKAARDHEGQMLQSKHGWTREQAAGLRAARDIADAGFELQVANLREARQLAAEIGNADSDDVIKTIDKALIEMGDRRGSFVPRIRKPGSWLMYAVLPRDEIEAQKPPEEWTGQEVMIPAETKAGWATLKTWHEKQGYHVRDISRSKNMPEDVFELAGTTLKMQAFMDAALDKIALGDNASWEDIGVTASVDAMGRAAYSSPDTSKTGLSRGAQGRVFKEYGGEFDSSQQRWVFEDMSADKDKRMREAMLGNLAEDTGKQMKVKIGEMIARNISNMYKARGARAHMIKRSAAVGQDVVRGYEEDPSTAFTKYVMGLAAGEAKRQSALDMVNAFTGRDISFEEWSSPAWKKDIDPETGQEMNSHFDYVNFTKSRRVDPINSPVAHGEGLDYMKDQLRNQEAADRLIGKIKTVAVLKYLGFRFLAAPLINMTAMVTNAPATISGYGEVPLSKAIGHLGKAYIEYNKFVNFKGMSNTGTESGDQFKRRVMKALGIDEETYDLYRIIQRNKWDEAQYNREALEGLQSSVGKQMSKVIEFAMFTFGLSERMNRVGTILAGFRAIKDKTMVDERTGEERKMTVDDRAKMAKEMMSDTAHAIYGKPNRPNIARGTNPTARGFQLFYVFQTFLHNSMNTMYDLGFTRKQRKAAAWMLVMPSLLAGGGASWLTKKMIKEVGKMLGEGDDPEENFYDYMDKEFGEFMSELTRYGLAGMGGYGINLKGSLENMAHVPTSIADLIGAPGSMFFDVWKGSKDIAQGEVYRGVERMVPLAAQSAMKGVREYRQGLTTSSNMPIFWGNERATANQSDMWLRIFGFNPARVAKMKEVQWHDRLAAEKMREKSSEILSRARAYMLRPPEDRTKADWLSILEDIADYNAIAKTTRLGITPITEKRLRANLKRAFKPPKRERTRAENMAERIRSREIR